MNNSSYFDNRNSCLLSMFFLKSTFAGRLPNGIGIPLDCLDTGVSQERNSSFPEGNDYL